MWMITSFFWHQKCFILIISLLSLKQKIKEQVNFIEILQLKINSFQKHGYTLINQNNRQNTRCRLFKIQGFFVHKTLRHAKPKGVLRRQRLLSLCLVIQRCLCGTPLGFCLRVIVNEEPLDLDKTTSCGLYVVLINLWIYYS